jgi:hypothetical protein
MFPWSDLTTAVSSLQGEGAIQEHPRQSARFVGEAELSSPRQLNKRPGGGGTPRGMAPKIKPSMQAKSYSP